MKRTLSLILAMLMVVTIFAAVGMAEDEPETTGEPEAVETAAPAAEEPAAPVEEAPAEPAPAAEPVSEPAPISEEPAPTPITVVDWVELDCNGGSYLGYTKFYADVFNGNLHSGIKPVRDGYTFAGWFVDKPNGNPDESKAIHDGESIQGNERKTLFAGWEELPKPEVTTNNYKYGVWLTVVNGDFKDSNAGKASVWVEFTEKTRLLPSDGLPTATRSNGTFEGWYTQAPTEELKNGHWSTVTKNGVKIVPGETEVPQGVQVLYAAFNDKETPEESEKLVTFKLNWNGMFGKTAAMTCIRSAGSSFTAKDAAVLGMNYVYDDPKAPKDDDISWDSLKEYWKTAEFDGYTFLGWSLSQDGEIIDQDTPITDDMVFYAQSEKDGSKVPAPTPAPTPGPVDHIHIVAPHMTVRQDPSKTDDVTVTAFVTPVGSTDEITWKVEVPPTLEENDYKELFKGQVQTYTIKGSVITKVENEDGVMTKDDPKFTAKAEGLTLTITPKQGCTQALYVSAKCDVSGKSYETPAKATVVITHTPDDVGTVTHAATCTAEGEVAILCTECGEATEVHTIPATGHTYEVEKTGVENGVPVYTKTCIHHDATETFKGGDVNGDGTLNTRDVRLLFQVVAGVEGKSVEEVVGDVTGDGVVNTRDVRAVFQYVAGVKDTLG